MQKSVEEIREQVDRSMRQRYRIGLDEMVTTSTPGYWQDKEPKLHIGHPLHNCMFCDGPFKATYTFFDEGRLNGRFVSPTASWKAIRESERR